MKCIYFILPQMSLLKNREECHMRKYIWNIVEYSRIFPLELKFASSTRNMAYLVLESENQVTQWQPQEDLWVWW